MSHCILSLLIVLVWNLQNVSGCLLFSILFLLMAPILDSLLIIFIIAYQHVCTFLLNPVNIVQL